MVDGWTQFKFFGRKVGKTRIFEVCLFIKKTQVVTKKTESEPYSRLYNEHITFFFIETRTGTFLSSPSNLSTALNGRKLAK